MKIKHEVYFVSVRSWLNKNYRCKATQSCEPNNTVLQEEHKDKAWYEKNTIVYVFDGLYDQFKDKFCEGFCARVCDMFFNRPGVAGAVL